MTPSLGKALVDAALAANQTRPLPLDLLTGRLKVAAIGTFTIDPAEDSSILYQTAQPPAALDHFASLAVGPGAATGFYCMLTSAPGPSRFIQIHSGILLPAAGARPVIRSPLPNGVPRGGMFLFEPPGGLVRPAGFVVVTSSTQDTFTDIPATTELLVSIIGRTS